MDTVRSDLAERLDQPIVTHVDNRKNMERWKNIGQWLLQAIKKQPVLTIAVFAMLITCIFVPVDAAYREYFNWTTLATLYCTLAVVEALSQIHIFEIIRSTLFYGSVICATRP